MKKILVKTFLFSILCFSLTGCGKKEEVINYDLTAYTVDQLQSETYYVQTDNGFYPVAKGVQTIGENEEEIATTVSNERMVWFGPDDAQIPTLYKNQSLVFVTNQQIPASWTFERYEDLGYTIGVRGLTENTGGRFDTVIDGCTLHPLSSAYQSLQEVPTNTILGIDQIGSTKITKDYVSRGGTVMGLTKGQTYNVDIYKGSSYLQASLTADTHAFVSYELFTTTEYTYNQTYYVTISIPDYFLSGYYYINGAGLFKYVANDAAQGISGIDFNVPYYVGVDDDGNLLTKEQYEQYLNGEYVAEKEASEKTDETTNEWSFTQTIDNTMEQLDMMITYSDMYIAPKMETKSAQLEQAQTTNQMLSAETEEKEETIPIAKLISPSNKEFIFENNSTEEGKTLTCSVTMPESGDWTIKLYGMETKVFNISSNINSGHSNSVVHTGSGTAEMNYYLSNALKNGVLEVTWENTDRAAVIEIIGPDQTKYTTNTEANNNEQLVGVISSNYGEMTLKMGVMIAGNYTIKITGEDLGRCRFATSEYDEEKYNSTSNSDQEENTETTKTEETTNE